MKDQTQNRVVKLFADRPNNILSIFYTAGFPTLDATGTIAKYLENSGANLIEIGVPFSDPVADGEMIQESSKVALNNGMNVALLLHQVTKIRETLKIPIILMSYLNPVWQYGIRAFARDAARAGIDGVIIPDMLVNDTEDELRTVLNEFYLTCPLLISPTTSEERIRKIDKMSTGFVYAVSSSSTTGFKRQFTVDQIAYFERLKKMNLTKPWLIGFGISNHETYVQVCKWASGAIIGSAFINMLKKSTNMETDIKKFILDIKE